MAYTLQQIFDALSKTENGGVMVADLQNLISQTRNEAAASRVDRNKVLDALGLRDSQNPEGDLKNMVLSLAALKKAGNPENLGAQMMGLQNKVKDLEDKYAASEKKAADEKNKRIATAMHSALSAALAKGNALNPETFTKVLQDQVVVNDDDTLGFKSGDKTITIDAGVADWLAKNPWAVKNTSAGGAGSGGAGRGGSKVYTMDDLKGMTPEQINEHWSDIKTSLKKG